MNRIILVVLFFFITLIFSSHVNAIVIRHDVQEEKYQASLKDFPALARFYVDGAHGALIKPTWVLTAAHTTFCTASGATILVGSEKAKVKRRYIHPDHAPGVSHDIALIELDAPAANTKPALLYDGLDEKGKVITFIGAGDAGNGLEGVTIPHYENNGVLRTANNTVEEADGPLLVFKFHQGEEALPLEGISGGGDSGGPAFIKKGDDYLVLGVSSRGEVGSTIGMYGNLEFYSRVSYFSNWINAVINGDDKVRSQITLPKLKHLMAGLTEETLPEICADIGIAAD